MSFLAVKSEVGGGKSQSIEQNFSTTSIFASFIYLCLLVFVFVHFLKIFNSIRIIILFYFITFFELQSRLKENDRLNENREYDILHVKRPFIVCSNRNKIQFLLFIYHIFKHTQY